MAKWAVLGRHKKEERKGSQGRRGLCLEKHSTRVAVGQVEEVRALINVAAGSRVTLRSTHPTRWRTSRT